MDLSAILVALEKLQSAVETRKFSEQEIRRVHTALSVVYERLMHGDYERFSHTSNVFDVPNRAQDFFTELEFHCYLGRTWSQILKQIPIGEKDTIADLCPGYNPKIELGLLYTGFNGGLDVLDTDAGSIEHLKKFMALFDPKFHINQRVVDVFLKLNLQYDLVLGNHIFDDLIMYYYATQQHIALGEIYASEDRMKQLWKDIISDQEKVKKEITPLIAEIFIRTVKAGGYVCLTQYPSYMERMLDIPHVSDFNHQVASDVCELLKENGFVQDRAKIEAAFKDHVGHFGIEHCFLLQRQS